MTLSKECHNLPISALQRLFSKTTTSYKFLVFLSLLRLLRRDRYQETEYEESELLINAALSAWHLHGYFRLSFGQQDRIGQLLDGVSLPPRPGWIGNEENRKQAKTALLEQLGEARIRNALSSYVIFRLLSPFFEEQLRGLSDHERNGEILKLAASEFSKSKPLYRIEKPTRGRTRRIIIHPDWLSYFSQNHGIMQGWAERQFVSFLDKYNPGIPGIAAKLDIQPTRPSLTTQRKLWKRFIQEQPTQCIYSDQPLDPNEFDLDHFIPWSFVGHNQIWNLAPTTVDANRRKGNQLPNIDQYIDRLARLHSAFLNYLQNPDIALLSGKTAAEYKAGLKAFPNELVCDQKAIAAYRNALNPQVSIAKSAGFPCGWKY